MLLQELLVAEVAIIVMVGRNAVIHKVGHAVDSGSSADRVNVVKREDCGMGILTLVSPEIICIKSLSDILKTR